MLKTHYIIQFFILSSLLAFTTGHGQNIRQTNPETIRLTTDRSLYLSGETLFFSAAYFINPNQPESLSKVMYIELFDVEGKTVAAAKFEIINNLCQGQLIIPSQSKSGYYIMRAYTRFQQNFPESQIASVVVTIINPEHPLPPVSYNKSTNPLVYFSLSESVFGFQIQQPVLNQVQSIFFLCDTTLIDKPTALYGNGLGYFKIDYCKTKKIQLGTVLSSGDTLWGKLLNPENIDINSKKLTSILPVDTGTNAQTETNFFVKGLFKQHETIDVELPEAFIGSSEFVCVSVSIAGTSEYVNVDLPDYLIDNPRYLVDYPLVFGKNHAGFRFQKELLTSFKQLDVKANGLPTRNYPTAPTAPEITGLTLSGKITESGSQKPLKDEVVYCALLSEPYQFHATKTDETGSFIFPLYLVEGLKNLYLSTTPNTENSSIISVNKGYLQSPPEWNNSPFIVDTNKKPLLKRMNLNKQIASVYNLKPYSFLKIKELNLHVFGNFQRQTRLSDFVQMATTRETINELVPFVRVRKKDGHFKIVVLDEVTNIEYDNPLVLVDGIPFHNIDAIMALQPTEIKAFQVISRVFAHGQMQYNGIVSILTTGGDFASLPMPSGGVFIEYETLNRPAIFSDSAFYIATAIPDFLNTTYWKTYKSNQMDSTFKLIAPDVPGDYDLTITSFGRDKKSVLYQKITVQKRLQDK